MVTGTVFADPLPAQCTYPGLTGALGHHSSRPFRGLPLLTPCPSQLLWDENLDRKLGKEKHVAPEQPRGWGRGFPTGDRQELSVWFWPRGEGLLTGATGPAWGRRRVIALPHTPPPRPPSLCPGSALLHSPEGSRHHLPVPRETAVWTPHRLVWCRGAASHLPGRGRGWGPRGRGAAWAPVHPSSRECHVVRLKRPGCAVLVSGGEAVMVVVLGCCSSLFLGGCPWGVL